MTAKNVDTGWTVICRDCGAYIKPADAAEGTIDDNRTCLCKACDFG